MKVKSGGLPFALAIVFSLVFGLFSAFQNPVRAEEGAKEAVIWHWFLESEVEGIRPMLDGVVSVDPEASVRFEKLPIGTWSVEENSRNALLMLAHEGRPLADLSFAEPFVVAELAERGLLNAMPEAVKLPKRLEFASAYRGKTVMLPLGTYSYALAYDPAALAEVGYPDGPKTWAELVDAGKKLVRDDDGDGVPERYGLGLKLRSGRTLEMSDLFLYLYQSKGGKIEVENGALSWDRDAAKWAFGQLYDAGYRWMSPPRVSEYFPAGMQLLSSDRTEAFVNEHAGWKTTMLPAVDGNLRLPIRSYVLVWLKSGRPGGAEAAEALLTYVSKPQLAGMISQQTGFLPIHKNASTTSFIKKIAGAVVPLPLFPERQRFDDLLVEAAGDAFGRLQTPEALVDYVEGKLSVPGPETERVQAGPDGSVSPYGVCHGGDWNDMRELGFRWVRKDYSMSGTERPDGSYNWDRYREDALKGRETGVIVLPILDYSSSAASGAPDDLKSDEERDKFMPRLDRWEAYVREGVRSLKDVVKIWEVWNEPNIEVFQRPVPNATRFAELMKLTYKIIKEEDPTATVMVAGTSGIPMRWFERLWEAGAADYADIWAVHPYINLIDLADGSYIDQLKLFKRQLDRYGESKPVWITEVGFALSENREAAAVDLEGQAIGVIKTHCQTFASRAVDKVIWYNYNGGEFALRKGDDIRPSHVAFAFMTRALGHEPELVDYYRAANGDEYYLFDRDGVPVLVLWNGKKESSVNLSGAAAKATLYNYLGEPVQNDGFKTNGQLNIANQPIYVEGENGSMPEFRKAFWSAATASDQ